MRLNTDRFYEELHRSGMKQKELASVIGVTEVSISRYANGERQPRNNILLKMARALQTSPEYLVGLGLDHMNDEESYLNVCGNIRAHGAGWTVDQKKHLMEILVQSF